MGVFEAQKSIAVNYNSKILSKMSKNGFFCLEIYVWNIHSVGKKMPINAYTIPEFPFLGGMSMAERGGGKRMEVSKLIFFLS